MLDMLKCLTYVSFLLFILSLSGIYVTLAFSFTIFSLSKVECYGRKVSKVFICRWWRFRDSDTWFIFQNLDGNNEFISIVFVFTSGVIVTEGFGWWQQKINKLNNINKKSLIRKWYWLGFWAAIHKILRSEVFTQPWASKHLPGVCNPNCSYIVDGNSKSYNLYCFWKDLLDALTNFD